MQILGFAVWTMGKPLKLGSRCHSSCEKSPTGAGPWGCLLGLIGLIHDYSRVNV